MALRLRVVSDHANRLGRITKVFGVHGGTIGRSTDNEWILPDPERYLSGKHLASIFARELRAGRHQFERHLHQRLQIPFGKVHDYLLRTAIIRLGEYELLVSIDKSNDFPPEESAIVAYDGQSPSAAARIDLQRSRRGPGLERSSSEPSDLGAPGGTPEGSVARCLRPDLSGRRGRRRAALRARGGRLRHALAHDDAAAQGRKPKSKTEPRGPRPTRGPHPRRARKTPCCSTGDFDLGLAAFCRGAGIDPRDITSEARSAALQLAGQLLREAVLGLMDLNQSRNEFRNRFRIRRPPDDGPESPLNFSRGVDEAMVRLLTTMSTRAGSVEAIRQNFRELKAQNTATLAATRAAFEEFLGRVDPKELEERFDRATKRGVFGSQNKAKYWDLYAEMFAGLAQRPADGFPARLHRDVRQGLRSETADPGSAAAQRLWRRSRASRAIREQAVGDPETRRAPLERGRSHKSTPCGS